MFQLILAVAVFKEIFLIVDLKLFEVKLDVTFCCYDIHDDYLLASKRLYAIFHILIKKKKFDHEWSNN